MSFENNLKNEKVEAKPNIDISVVKYFWQRSPLSSHKREAIPNFLREIPVLKNFSDLELRTFSRFLHRRTFTANEIIFNENDVGLGFYFILSGHVDLYGNTLTEQNNETRVLVASLEKSDYFGEIAILKPNSLRTAMAQARNSVVLLGVFKPDMEELIHQFPTIGAKLLQSIAVITANRFTSIAEELKVLKRRVINLESSGKN